MKDLGDLVTREGVALSRAPLGTAPLGFRSRKCPMPVHALMTMTNYRYPAPTVCRSRILQHGYYSIFRGGNGPGEKWLAGSHSREMELEFEPDAFNNFQGLRDPSAFGRLVRPVTCSHSLE